MSSLVNALQMLTALSERAPELGVTDLSERLGLPKSSISRTLKDLEEFGFLERTPKRTYRPGRQLFRIGSLYKHQGLPIHLFDEQLEGLLDRFPASGYVAVLNGLDCVILRMREGNNPIRLVLREGSIVPAYTVAIGRMMLARLNPNDLAKLLPASVSHTQPDYQATRSEMLAEIEIYRDQGWADLRNLAPRGIGAVGVAVKGEGQPPVGCALCYMTSTTPTEVVTEITGRLMEVARSVGGKIGDPTFL